jgi:hypothetical protein
MQQLVRPVLSGLLAAFTLSIPIALSGCGVVTWKEVYCANQPHGNARACVAQKCGFADCSVRIKVDQGWRSAQISYRRGCTLNFAQASWVGPVVGVFVDGGYCQQIEAAYDVESNRAVPFSAAEVAVRSAVVREYGVGPGELKASGGDVLAWATYPGDGSPRRSKDEFSRRYPH